MTRPARRRAGIRSAHLFDHTVLYLFRAWMTDLDRDRFELFFDGVRWSGGRTTLEAVAWGLLPLTTPGPFMRGRHTAGILTELGLPEAVATDKAALVELAARAATDRAWHVDLRARMIAGRDALFVARAWKPALEGWLADPG